MSVAEALDATFSAYAAKHGKPRWGDKTPMYMRHLDLLDGLFPDAQYVHLVRDGRDAALAFLDMPCGVVTRTWAHPRSPAGFACEWSTEVARARALGRRIGASRYFEIRYEDLVEDTAGVSSPSVPSRDPLRGRDARVLEGGGRVREASPPAAPAASDSRRSRLAKPDERRGRAFVRGDRGRRSGRSRLRAARTAAGCCRRLAPRRRSPGTGHGCARGTLPRARCSGRRSGVAGTRCCSRLGLDGGRARERRSSARGSRSSGSRSRRRPRAGRHARSPWQDPPRDEPRTIRAVFAERSYAPGARAVLKVRAPVPRATLRIYRAGPERRRPTGPYEMLGVSGHRAARDRARWCPHGRSPDRRVGERPLLRTARSVRRMARVRAGRRPAQGSGCPARRGRPPDQHVAGVQLPRRRRERSRRHVVREPAHSLRRPLASVPRPRCPVHADPGLHALVRARRSPCGLPRGRRSRSDAGAETGSPGSTTWSSSRHTRSTCPTHVYDVVERFRDLGGNLAFLSANTFFYRVERRRRSDVPDWPLARPRACRRAAHRGPLPRLVGGAVPEPSLRRARCEVGAVALPGHRARGTATPSAGSTGSRSTW